MIRATILTLLLPLSTWAATIPGDIDKDGDVDFDDFITLARNFGRTDTPAWPQEATPRERAEALMGFWFFHIPAEDKKFEFLMGHIQGEGEEISVTGTDANGVIVGGYYQPNTETFLITQALSTEQYFFDFSINDPADPRVTGRAAKWVYGSEGDRVENLGTLGTSSGRFIVSPSSFTIHLPP